MNLEMNLEMDLEEYLSPSIEKPIKNQKNLNLSVPYYDVKYLLSQISSKPYNSSPFEILETQLNPIIEEEELSLLEKEQPYIIDLIKNIEKVAKEHLLGYDPLKVDSFNFELPPTVFSTISKKVNVQRNETEGPEYIETSSLTWHQRWEIFKSGRFTVGSVRYKQDYIWKMSSWIVKGRKNINQSFKDDMISARKMLKGWWKAFYQKKTNHIFESNIINGMTYIWDFIRNLVSIFVGYPKNYPIKRDSTSNFISDYWLELLDDNSIDKSLWRYFFERKKHGEITEENSNYTYLITFQSKFEEIWKKMKYIEEKNLENNEFLKVKLLEIYYQKLSQFIIENNNKNNIIPEKLLKLLEYFKCLQFIHYQVFKYSQLYDENLKKIPEDIKAKHSFLSNFDCFYDKKLKEYQRFQREKLDQERNTEISQYFKTNDFHEQLNLFQRYLKFLDYYHENHDAANLLMLKYEPYRRFNFTVQLFPCSWYVETYQDNYNETKYVLIRTKTLTFSTKFCLWRFLIMLVRYRAWVQNAMYWLFVMAIVGPLGIRALCGISAFYPDKECDKNTGEIKISTSKKIDTVISYFIEVLKSIKEDREEFESMPDTGFFGKKISRICNLFFNYVFKLLFVGVFLVLACLPIIITFNVLICLLLAITSCLWMPFALVFLKIWQLLIYDNDNEKGIEGPESHTFEYFPLFGEVLITLGYYCFFQILFAVTLLIVKPILFVIIIVFGICRFVVRSFYDIVMMIFVFLFGRVPASDTSIAWKISGPVVSRTFYDKMSIEDALKLYIKNLESIELKKYEAEIRIKVNKKLQEIERFYRNLNKPFGIISTVKNYHNSNNSLKNNESNLYSLKQCENILLKKLQDSIHLRYQNCPSNFSSQNVRFTFVELESLQVACKEVLKTFVERRNFESNWENKDFLEERDLKEINEEVMCNAINSRILEPYEELDDRIELVDQRNQFGTIKDVLHGKKGNEFENLEVKIMKEREEYGVKYILVESRMELNDLNTEFSHIQLENSMKCNVNFTEMELKQAEELRSLKIKLKKK